MTTPVSSTTTTPPATTSSTSTSAADSAQQQLSSNFDTFLTLLTTQLQNQDPLSPMDSNQFTQQLVEFSQVEQQIDSNKNLESLISLTKSQSATNAVSYLGKTLTTTDGTGALQNGQADWTYSLGEDAVSNTLIVTDSSGRVVYTAPGATTAGAHDFQWNGNDNSGNTMPDGTYTLSVHASLGSGDAADSSVTSKGQVDEVDLTGDEPVLMVGSMGVPLSKASLISGM
jgi:flagellar basal-body rod modification protein FlgD